MRRVAVPVAVLVTVAVVAVVMTRLAGSGESDSQATAPSARVGSPAGMPRASQPTPSPDVDVEGARRAAADAVALTDEVVTAGLISRRDLIAGFTTAEFGGRLADETSAQVNALLVELGERDADPARLAVLEQPITATGAATSSGVRVEVWSVLVVAVPGVGPARQVWHTVTLDMVLVDGRWLVDSWSSVPGPSPALPVEVTLDPAEAVAERIDSAARGGGG